MTTTNATADNTLPSINESLMPESGRFFQDKAGTLGSDVMNMERFQEVLQLDDEDSLDFSFSIAQEYFTKGETFINEMEQALLSKNLESFRTPAHLLTENSHLLGAERVEVSCGPICNYSWGNNPDGNPVSNEVALEHIAALLPCVKQDLGEAELHYKAWFKERNLEL